MYIFWALLCVIAWGTNASVTRISATEFPIFLFISLRFLFTGLIFLPFAKLQKKDAIKLLNIGVMFNVVHIGLVFFGLYYLSAASSASIQQIQVPMAMILAFFVFKEKLNKMQIIGTIIAISGIIVIYGAPEVNIIGLIVMILAALAWAIVQLQMKKYGHFHMTTFVAYTSLFSVPFLLLLSYFFDKPLVIENVNFEKLIITLGYQVLALGFITAIWQRLVEKEGINKIAPFSLLSIIFAILSGIILLDEPLTKNIAIGASIITLGVFITNKFKNSIITTKK